MSLGVGGEQEGAGVHPAREGRGDHPPGEGMHRSHAERGTPTRLISSVEILHLPHHIKTSVSTDGVLTAAAGEQN